MFEAIHHYPLPVVAVVQGAAVAGGCELARISHTVDALVDAVYASTDAGEGITAVVERHRPVFRGE